MMALARKIVSGEEDGTETVEEVFAQARDAVSGAEELLVDADWSPVEVEPEAVMVNGDRNVHDEHADESQRSLFSWAEFVAAETTGPNAARVRQSPIGPALSTFPVGMAASTGAVRPTTTGGW